MKKQVEELEERLKKTIVCLQLEITDGVKKYRKLTEKRRKGDDADFATLDNILRMVETTISEKKLLLERCFQALERIQIGTYGICPDCGNEIAAKRLDFDPAVGLCIKCQTAFEEKRYTAKKIFHRKPSQPEASL